MKVSRSCLLKITVIIIMLSYICIFINSNSDIKSNDLYVYDIESDIILVSVSDVSFEEEIIYDNMTYDELVVRLEKYLNNELDGYGDLIASYSLEKGVDPYLASAIMLHETGCKWNCSKLVKQCHNVGGMKGNGCGEYGYFDSMEEGIKRFIDNIFNNYYVYGLTTAELMGNKYAEDPGWAMKVNGHIENIKNG